MNDTKVNRLLTRNEVSARLHVSMATLDRLVARKDLTALKVGRGVRFRETDVDIYLDRSAA